MSQRNLKNQIDPDLPFDSNGKVYHLACTGADIADNFIFVGDPARVSVVAQRFDEGSITFTGSHREIGVTTGRYKGVPVTCLSTGMGPDNIEIVINEIHALKEYNPHTNEWIKDGEEKAKNIRIVRVGTCGSPSVDAEVGDLAISRHAIGMDNTCRYYKLPTDATIDRLAEIANKTDLKNAGGVYATSACPDIYNGLAKAASALPSGRKYNLGITATGSGFYGCQGRIVGRFAGKVAVPDLVAVLGQIELPIEGEDKPEKVVNIEMEVSAVCGLSSILGYRAGALCVIVAKRAGDVVDFATPDVVASAMSDAISIALATVISA
eukprot:GILI01009978.1.p1 GENE.GILI01009978.1~~GILI01009978.1.p1  ORF type:complete len:323 (-),score=81.51 GILI01009978.1:273-1241(-)